MSVSAWIARPVRAVSRRPYTEGVLGDARPIRSEQGVDFVEHRAVSPFQACVLAFVLLPGSDEKGLDEQVCVLQVPVEVPTECPGASPRVTELARGNEKCHDVAWRQPVLDRRQHRSLLDCALD